MDKPDISTLFSRSPFGLALLDSQDRIVQANESLARMVGCSTSELQSRTLPELWHGSGDGNNGERRIRRDTGDIAKVKLVTWPAGTTPEADGGRTTVALVETIQEQNVERNPFPATFDQIRRLSSIVAHHVRNPLAGISGALSILRDRLPMSIEDQAIVQEILERLGELSDSVEDLVAYGRPIAPQPRSLSALALMKDVASRLPENGFPEIQVQLPERDMVRIWGDGLLLARSFDRLFVNAAEAMHGHGTITVRLREDCLNGAPKCIIEIVDDGPGVPKEARAHMFEPFFTTKAKHVGLGLSVARRILQAHGGEIAYRSTDDADLALVVVLPVQAA